MSLTVVLPNFNHGHVIGPQLEAIFSQSTPPTDVIIIDDASTDDSVERIRHHIAGRRNARLICRERNAGVIAAMNEGLKMCSTEYASFAAADDLVLPGLYEKSIGLLNQHPRAALCSAVTLVERVSGKTRFPLPPAYPCPAACFVKPARAAHLLLSTETWLMGTVIVHRRRCLIETGGFRPELESYCDGFLYLVQALRYGSCFIPEPLAVWRLDERGYSKSTARSEEMMKRIRQAANTLMRTEFADLFPPKLRQRVSRRLLFRELSAKARSRIVQAALFLLLRSHDLPVEVRSRLARGTIAGAP